MFAAGNAAAFGFVGAHPYRHSEDSLFAQARLNFAQAFSR
jgi:hypothetical protein